MVKVKSNEQLRNQLAEAATLRKAYRLEFGQWLKAQRMAKELTMLDVANVLGFPYYNDVSIYEHGRAAIPSQYYKAWASALGVPLEEFAKRTIRAYDPVAHDILFGSGRGTPSAPKVKK